MAPGNLVITARAAGGSLHCYYGPCEYTSARLKTLGKREIGYGRVEARIRLPRGAGLWPAFWSMGTDIGQVGWPQTGEIDIMEWVGRQPDRIFGTIHGPGYSGGASFGGTRNFGRDISEETHTFAIEREPGHIRWYVDGELYHQATPADVAPDPWVFEHPFFLLLNVAVGGNFGGPVAPETLFPQSMAVDYIRVYGAPDTAERFEAPFVDDSSGWREITVPFGAFQRSAHQPEGAPNDGFGRATGLGLRLRAARGRHALRRHVARARGPGRARGRHGDHRPATAGRGRCVRPWPPWPRAGPCRSRRSWRARPSRSSPVLSCCRRT